MSLRVLHLGACSLIVDEGRPRTRSLGVPVGGAADRRSWRLGNALLGNDPTSPALEVSLSGPRLRAEESVGGVVFGAPFEVWRNGTRIDANKSFTLDRGDELAIGGTPYGMRAYLCVVGGIDAPMVLNSRSGLEPIRAGDSLGCRPSRIGGRFVPELSMKTPTRSGSEDVGKDSLPLRVGVDGVRLRVTQGLQHDWFDERALLNDSFAVSPSSNRMGLRLMGPALVVPAREMISEPVCPGSIQVTREGQCIILGVDGQTIGGYPKIGQVISADLDLLGQLRPGEAVRFQEVTYEEAREIHLAREADLEPWLLRLRFSRERVPDELHTDQ